MLPAKAAIAAPLIQTGILIPSIGEDIYIGDIKTPTRDNQPATKKYVEDTVTGAQLFFNAPLSKSLANVVTIAEASIVASGIVSIGSQTFKGAKLFEDQPSTNGNPTLDMHLATKRYVDARVNDIVSSQVSYKAPVEEITDISTVLPVPVAGTRYIQSIDALPTFTKDYIYTSNAGGTWDGEAPEEGWNVYVKAGMIFADQNITYTSFGWMLTASLLNHQNLTGAGLLNHATIDARLGQDVSPTAAPSFVGVTVKNAVDDTKTTVITTDSSGNMVLQPGTSSVLLMNGAKIGTISVAADGVISLASADGIELQATTNVLCDTDATKAMALSVGADGTGYVTPSVAAASVSIPRVILSEASTLANHAINKGYVDANINQNVKSDASPSFVNVSSQAPTLDGHVTTKHYVDGLIDGSIARRDPVAAIGNVSGMAIPVAGTRYLQSINAAPYVKDYIYESNGVTWLVEIPSPGWNLLVQGGSTHAGKYITYISVATGWVLVSSLIDHTDIQSKGTLTHAQIDGYLNQAVKTTSNPQFGSLTLTGTLTGGNLDHVNLANNGTLTHAQIDGYLDQSVKQASSPTFASLTLIGTLTGGNLDHVNLANNGTLTHAQIDGYLDQAVQTTSSPTFANVIINNDPSLVTHAVRKGYWDTFINQAVLTSSSPTFTSLAVVGTITSGTWNGTKISKNYGGVGDLVGPGLVTVNNVGVSAAFGGTGLVKLTSGTASLAAAGTDYVGTATLLSSAANQDVTIGGTYNAITASIGANKVTLAKIQQIANNTVLGNVSGASAVPSALAVSATATNSSVAMRDAQGGLVATTLDASSLITGDHLTAVKSLDRTSMAAAGAVQPPLRVAARAANVVFAARLANSLHACYRMNSTIPLTPNTVSYLGAFTDRRMTFSQINGYIAYQNVVAPQGAVKLKYSFPTYRATSPEIITIRGDDPTANYTSLRLYYARTSDDSWKLFYYNAAGVQLSDGVLALSAKGRAAGTEFEIEVNWDTAIAKKAYVFVDGVAITAGGIDITDTSPLTTLRIGASDGQNFIGYIRDLIVYNTTQHTTEASYVPGYSVDGVLAIEDSVEITGDLISANNTYVSKICGLGGVLLSAKLYTDTDAWTPFSANLVPNRKIGTPAFANKSCNLTGAFTSSMFVAWEGFGLVPQKGCMRFTYIPTYTTAPSTASSLASIAANWNIANNMIEIYQLSTSGDLVLAVTNNAGVTVSSPAMAGASVAMLPDVPLEVEIDWDLDAALVYGFINGVSLATSGVSTTGVIDLDMVLLGTSVTRPCQGKYKDLVVYNTNKHTTESSYVVDLTRRNGTLAVHDDLTVVGPITVPNVTITGAPASDQAIPKSYVDAKVDQAVRAGDVVSFANVTITGAPASDQAIPKSYVDAKVDQAVRVGDGVSFGNATITGAPTTGTLLAVPLYTNTTASYVDPVTGLGTAPSGGTVLRYSNDTCDLTGSNYLYWEAAALVSTQGCVRFKYYPKYTGAPTASVGIVQIKADFALNTNNISFWHSSSSSRIYCQTQLTSSGHDNAIISNVMLVANTAYEVEINWDFNANKVYAFWNGTNMDVAGIDWPPSATKPKLVNIGASPTAANACFSDLIVYNSCRHTTEASYITGYSVAGSVKMEPGASLSSSQLVLAENSARSRLSAVSFFSPTVYAPSAAMVFAARIRTNTNYCYGTSGTVTSIIGTPTFNNGCDLSGAANERYLAWSGDVLASNKGCLRFIYVPKYSGNPPEVYTLCRIMKTISSWTHRIAVTHQSDGDLGFHSSTTDNFSITLTPGVSMVSGTAYEIEVNWDYNAGTTYAFFNGVSFNTAGLALTAVVNKPTFIGIGCVTTAANAVYRDVAVYNAVQHTTEASYTVPGYSLTGYLTTDRDCGVMADHFVGPIHLPSTGAVNYSALDYYEEYSSTVDTSGAYEASVTIEFVRIGRMVFCKWPDLVDTTTTLEAPLVLSGAIPLRFRPVAHQNAPFQWINSSTSTYYSAWVRFHNDGTITFSQGLAPSISFPAGILLTILSGSECWLI